MHSYTIYLELLLIRIESVLILYLLNNLFFFINYHLFSKKI